MSMTSRDGMRLTSEHELQASHGEVECNPAQRPDFSGSWVCTQVDGDWDRFLREQGASWAARTAAACLGYGAGREVQIIEQDDEQIRVVSAMGSQGRRARARRVDVTLNMDGVPEKTLDFEGRPGVSVTAWDGETLLVRHTPTKLQRPRVWVAMFTEGDIMCSERMSAKGTVARRYYERRAQ